MKALYGQRSNYNYNVKPEAYLQIRSEMTSMGYSQYAVPVPVPRQPEPIGFSRVIKFWLSVKEGEVRENSSAGYEYISYKHVIPYFEKLGLAVHEIQLMDIQQYFFEMGKSLKPSTLDKHFTVINGALKFARSNLNLIYYNPAEDFTKPKKQQRMYSCFNVDELSDLLQMVEGSILEAPVILASSFGLRRSETLGLRWASLDHKARSIAINHTMCRGRKGYIAGDLVKEASSYRTFALEPDVREYLMRLYNHQRQMKLKYKDKYIDSDYICRWDNGRSIRPDYVSREFPKFLSANNLKVIRFHDLRHSAASNLLNAGFDIYEICEWLGHSDIRSTQRYLHLAFESKRKISKFMDNALFKKRKTITRYEEE